MSNEKPIFIVGASRSGTALMRSILNNDPSIWISQETHYFDDLRGKLGARSRRPLSETDERRCQDYFLALSSRPYGHGGSVESSTLDRAELKRAADEIGCDADAYFEAFCKLRSRAHNKSSWGEKTPRHVFCIPEIVAKYPQAKVICMVRDARAVVLSYRDWKSQGGFDLEADPDHEQALRKDELRARRSYDILLSSLLWRSTVRSAIKARQVFGPERIYIQRYETLALEPEQSVRALMKWLGRDFDPVLLDVPIHNSSFTQFHREGGFSLESLERWKIKMSEQEIAVIQASCRRALRDAGYELHPVKALPGLVAWKWLTLPISAGRAFVANRNRIGNLPRYLARRLK